MTEYYLAGAALRLFQTIVYASMWIVVGCVIAAIFQRMIGARQVRRIFADQTRYGLLAGWLIGMLLPVCSLGVIPIVRELHRAGVKRGTIVAFGLTAPLFNPMSVLYGLTLSDPIAIIAFSLCALVIVSFIGVIWNWLLPTEPDRFQQITVPPTGLKRSLALCHAACRELVSPSAVYIAIGISASVAVAALIPKGQLQHEVEYGNVFAPVSVALIATPIYSTPLLAMSQIGSMFQHGNSIGAAFSLLILGAGANIGLLAWIAKTYGVKKFFAFYSFLCLTTIGLACVVSEPLYPKGVQPAGHTHAFDVYTHPFETNQVKLFSIANDRAADFWISNEFGGTTLLGLMFVIGMVLWWVERNFDIETWLMEVPEKASQLEREVPGWVLGAVSVSGLVIASVVGCFIYYPAPDGLLRDLSAVNTEAVLSARNQQWEAADKWIRYCDDLSRRLEVGVYLRNGSVSEFKSTKAKIYREKLDDLKMIVDMRDGSNAQQTAMDVSNSYLRLSRSFKELGPGTD
jgi:uncharacterized membrane protein YraQ (UPF0718 family)